MVERGYKTSVAHHFKGLEVVVAIFLVVPRFLAQKTLVDVHFLLDEIAYPKERRRVYHVEEDGVAVCEREVPGQRWTEGDSHWDYR